VTGLAVVSFIGLDPVDALAALGRDATLTNRVPIWHLALGYIERRPWLGFGYEGFWRIDGVEANQIWATMYWRVPHAHNAWIEIGLSLGLIGIGAMAVMWLTALYRAIRIITLPQAKHAVFCLALLAGALMENMTEYAFFRRGEILWLLFVTVVVYLGRELAAAHDRARARAPSLPLARDALQAYAAPRLVPPPRSPTYG
jgi:exopolysaccharide production protein ExoQ